MALDTVVLQGRFTSTGTTQIIPIRSDVDWMEIYNYTVAGANQTTAIGVQYYWQRGMAAGTGIEYLKSNAAAAANLTQALASGGFTLIDTSASPLGPLNATLTAISTASIPVASNSGTNGLNPGDVVRFTNVTSAQQVGGLDFTVGYNTLSTSTFSLDYMAQLGLAGTTGSWRKILFNPIFYPTHRFISKITQAAQAVVTLTVTHGFTVGQAVRFIVPSDYGMTQIDQLEGNIVAINTTTTSGNTITVDIDTTSFTAFAFPATADVPFSPAMIVPVGEEATGSVANLLDDATINTAILGMSLAAGANSPAGQTNDVIYWKAGKAFSVNNQ